jgi:hypothetical protein
MPLPKVLNGQKISLMLPAEVVRRIKLEALDAGCLPTLIVQKALEGYWRIEGGDSASVLPRNDALSNDSTVSPPALPIPLRQMKQLTIMEAMLAEGRFTEQEFTTAMGKTPSALRAAWIKNKSGAMTEVVKIEKFISSKCSSRNDYLALLEATRVPGDDSSVPILR